MTLVQLNQPVSGDVAEKWSVYFDDDDGDGYGSPQPCAALPPERVTMGRIVERKDDLDGRGYTITKSRRDTYERVAVDNDNRTAHYKFVEMGAVVDGGSGVIRVRARDDS